MSERSSIFVILHPSTTLMWDLCYLGNNIPDEPFNLVINTAQRKLDEHFLSELALHANSVCVNTKTIENYPTLRSVDSIKVIEAIDERQQAKPKPMSGKDRMTGVSNVIQTTDKTLEPYLSQLTNDYLTLAYSDDTFVDGLQNVQVASRYGSNIHRIAHDESSVVLPKGQSVFVTQTPLSYYLFPLHGKTEVEFKNETQDGFDLALLDTQGEIETGKFEKELVVQTDMPCLIIFKKL